ncbi:scarecrow-like protein 32 [Quercus suber]|uniref:Scarecrow-like protein 32 n=1 Tax=Quercus suber TaxID=58331 RepID=A0AAW0LP83_QUESU
MLAAMANAHCNLAMDVYKFSIIELASFVDLTPWHRFGFTAANAAILDAVEGYTAIHIVDLSMTHCMQIPTLVDAIANRHEVPPLLKLTVVTSLEDVPPILDLSYDELGSKLVNFARSKNVMMEFRVIPSSYKDGLRSAFNYLWIPYDTMDSFLPRGSMQRLWYEADICWKIENVIAHEGFQRVERLEPKSRWVQRMRNANFRGIAFGEDAVTEVKTMLDEHAAGWGLKKEEEDLVLTWKGHNVLFATAWVLA